jgi:trehalose 6-phosphate phosphatase
MKNILSSAARELLREFVCSNVLVALDYDGTLAPIVADPALARMRDSTRDLMWELTRLYPVIVISGRAQADALKKVRGVGVLEVVGNHGLEPRHRTSRFAAEVRRWLPALEWCAGRFKGVTVEDKIFSVAVHYRHCREKKKARAALLAAAQELGDVRIIGGKQVLNVLPKGAPHKGLALERERGRLHCDTAIYVGDDETDEDVFALDQPGRLLTIRVGQNRRSAANYYLPNQLAIDPLLRALVDHRRESAQRRQATR